MFGLQNKFKQVFPFPLVCEPVRKFSQIKQESQIDANSAYTYFLVCIFGVPFDIEPRVQCDVDHVICMLVC